jgi:hypothetical protein
VNHNYFLDGYVMAITESHVGMKWSVIDVLSSNNNYIVIFCILGEIGGGYFFYTL